MAYGITNAGFIIKTLLDIEAEINSDYRGELGTSVNTNSTSVFGHLRDLSADMQGDIWDKINDVYNQLTVLGTGASLDLVAGLSGKRRIESTKSVIKDFQLSVTGNLSLPAGTTFSKEGDSTIIYELDEALSHTYTGSGIDLVDVDVTCTTFGVVSVADDSITVIDSPTANLASVTNDSGSTFVNGREEETDEELRARIQQQPFITVTGTESGIKRAILALNDIEGSGLETIDTVYVIPNKELYADSEGREGKSVEVVVYYENAPDSDTDEAIVRAMINSAPDPTNWQTTTGSSYSETVNLDGGNTRYTLFSRPATSRIYVDIDVTTADGALTADQKTALKTALASWGNNLGIAQDVIVFGADSISSILNTFDGADITDYEIGVSTSPAPTPATDDSNISIGYTQVSSWSVSDMNIGDL